MVQVVARVYVSTNKGEECPYDILAMGCKKRKVECMYVCIIIYKCCYTITMSKHDPVIA